MTKKNQKRPDMPGLQPIHPSIRTSGAKNTKNGKTNKPQNTLPSLTSPNNVSPDDSVVDVSPIERLKKISFRNIPSALVSLVFHLLLFLIIALIYIPTAGTGQFGFSLDISDGLDEEFDPLIEVAENEAFTPEFNLSEMNATVANDDAEFQPTLSEIEASAPTLESPSFEPSSALSGREGSGRQGMLVQFGGTPETENAVELGLKWLAKNQQKNGSWSLRGPFRSPRGEENSIAATGLALLAFLGHGETHLEGKYKNVVKRGIDSLIKNQSGNGQFSERGASESHGLYSHAICSIAICELLAMTQDESLIGPARDAIAFAEKAQGAQGGWKYAPGGGSDLSVTGWYVVLFQSAKYAGIKYDEQVLNRANGFVDSVMLADGSQFRYEKDHEPELAMTAVGFLCQQYFGWDQDDPRLVAGGNYFLKNPIRWTQKNVYYWYYATQVMRHLDDETWTKWNDNLKTVLPAKQLKSGSDAGSWDPEGDPYGGQGGRLYVTCLCIYSLEVYYRHLPIYQMRKK